MKNEFVNLVNKYRDQEIISEPKKEERRTYKTRVIRDKKNKNNDNKIEGKNIISEKVNKSADDEEEEINKEDKKKVELVAKAIMNYTKSKKKEEENKEK